MSNFKKLPTTAERSALMSKIRSKNTKPELAVRRMLHSLGYRFRLHVRELPGCPDIVLQSWHIIIQVKGCFWHGHTCLKGRAPRTNQHYWIPKLQNNKLRDKSNERKLRRMGWHVKTFWECNLKKMPDDQLRDRLLTIFAGLNQAPSTTSTKGPIIGAHSRGQMIRSKLSSNQHTAMRLSRNKYSRSQGTLRKYV